MNKDEKLLSIVVPCYNDESCIRPFLNAINDVGLALDFEVVFVDDGSTDGSLEAMKNEAERDQKIKFISFSRNFGKEAALYAGLRKARGDLVVTMDIDLQDPPALLPEMVAAIEEDGYDAVATRRCSREGEPPIRSWFAERFYQIMYRFSDVELVNGARDYRMMRRSVVNAVLSLREVNRFTKGIYQWVGFKTKWISYKNVERTAGVTKWSFGKLFVYAIDGMVAFSTLPLQVASCLGLISCALAFAALVFVIVRKLIFGDPVSGWASLVCIIVFLGGLNLLFIGILGMYLAKMYRETKSRPIYLVREEN